jgi:hypothetical protein
MAKPPLAFRIGSGFITFAIGLKLEAWNPESIDLLRLNASPLHHLNPMAKVMKPLPRSS